MSFARRRKKKRSVLRLDLRLLGGELGLRGSKSGRQAVLRVDTVNAVDGVEVLDAGNLEAGCATLAGGNRGVGKEVFPDLVLLAASWEWRVFNLRGTSGRRTWP